MAIHQVQGAPWRQEALQPVTRQRTPRSTHHQHNQARMHQQRSNTAPDPLAGRQSPGPLPHLPATLPQPISQVVHTVRSGVHGAADAEHRQLLQVLVVGPLQGRTEGGQLAPDAAQQQGNTQQPQQPQEPDAGIHVIQLQQQNRRCRNQAQPGVVVVVVVIGAGGLPLG